MAYYYFPRYEGSDIGEYEPNPYASNYGSVLPQGSLNCSNHEINIHNLFHYHPAPYYHAYDPTPNCSTIAYSVSSPGEPKSIEYDTNCYSSSYDQLVTTQFLVSYSVSSEFDLPEFEEYDPTPYNGGYDINQTYGIPLSPSDEICHPPSTTQQTYPPSFIDLKNGSVESFIEKEQIDEKAEKSQNGSKPTQANEVEEDNRLKETNGYEYDKQVSQMPSGYGLEAMDLCEGMFGYWPCLSRLAKRRNACQDVADNYEGSYGYEWQGTADDLFGSSNPYGEKRDVFGEIYGEAQYGYEKHHLEQSLYGQVEHESSWFNKFKIS